MAEVDHEKISKILGSTYRTPSEASLDELATVIRAVAMDNNDDVFCVDDWNYNGTLPSVIARCHWKLSAALDAYFNSSNRELFLEEMADVVIRVLDCVGGLTDRFGDVVAAKIENKARGYRHGGKRV